MKGALIQTLARLLKLPTLYELNNQAIQRAIQQSAPLLQDACARVEGGFALDFELPSGAYATTLLRELFVEVVAATGDCPSS